MQREEVKETFDRMADSYDRLWAKLAPINDSLHLLMGGALSSLPARARILCVGAGTGAEIIYLAKRFPEWTFVAVDPSVAMLDACRRRLSVLDIESRCEFHPGYLEALPPRDPFDAATSLLVSQFILDKDARSEYFKSISKRLKPGGILISSDLSADLNSFEYESLLQTWLEMMKEGGVPPESLEGMRKAYGKDVAVLPGQEIAALLEMGGFEHPIHFYQAGLIHAWFSTKADRSKNL